MIEPYFVITSKGGTIFSNEIASEGIGVEIQSSLTGMGLPPVSAQFDEGLGDGATYQGTRVLTRNLDFNAHCYAPDRERLRSIMDRFSMVLAHPCMVDFVDPESDETWSVEAVRSGGGDYSYGDDGDSGRTYFNLSWSMEASDPYWYAQPLTASAGDDDLIVTENPGTVPADAVWKIAGPTKGFAITREGEEVLAYNAFVPQGETVTIDTTKGTVRNQNGESRYRGMDTLDLESAAIPIGSGQFEFSWDQSSVEFEESLTRTNHATNPSLRVDPALYGNYTVGTVFDWDPQSDVGPAILMRRDTEASVNSASIYLDITGLTPGLTYEVIFNATQESGKVGAHNLQSGFLRVRDFELQLIGALTLNWIRDPSLVYYVETPTLQFEATTSNIQIQYRPPRFHYKTSGGSDRFYECRSGANTVGLAHLSSVYVGEPGGFFDGETPDQEDITYEWVGTPNQSKSTETRTWDTEVPIDGEGLSCRIEYRPRRWLVM